jgi:FtsH-binding integral membrane protein
MIERNRKFAVAVLVTCAFFAACSTKAVTTVVDTRPIGQGLEYVGIAVVLATLIIVFGKFLEK